VELLGGGGVGGAVDVGGSQRLRQTRSWGGPNDLFYTNTGAFVVK